MQETPCSVQLKVDDEIRARKQEFCTAVEQAMQNVDAFARAYKLEKYLEKPIISSAEVVRDRARLEHRLREMYGAPPSVVFPPGLSAGNDAKSILVIMPEEEAKKYSAKFIEAGFYVKLLTHELIHLLHIRLVDGKEDEMGPMWFFEGFAVMGSKQLENFEWPAFQKEFVEILDPKRGDYRKYGFAVRNLARKQEISELVQRARRADFDDWVKVQIQ